ncbi:MAG TPA: DUF2182 domain-containing protein, partial [Actinomycetota bacterium]|nr:DUF2182 domain-containing protein [Actinomycetota bacterium]
STWAASAKRFSWRHPEWVLGLVAAGGWVIVFVVHPGHTHEPVAGSWPALFRSWAAMVVAMMVPPALRMARYVAVNSRWRRRQRAAFLFAGSSLAVWLPAALAAAALAALPWVASNRRWLLGAALMLAAAWELSPYKRRALKACHRTIPLPPDGRKADKADIRLGLLYGRACFRACWSLMLPMVVAAHVSPLLMLALTAIAVAEEVVVKGYKLAPVAATLLVVAALMVLVLG